MRITAAILTRTDAEPPFAESRPLEIVELDLADPGPGEVRIRVAAAGICHSDLSVIDGTRPRPVPMALGHEASGTVEEVGAGVDNLSPGDHVICIFAPSCGACLPCAEGRPALCRPGAAASGQGMLLSGHRRLTLDGAPVHHHVGVSAFATHAVLSRHSLLKVDVDIAPEILALFSCAMLTGAGAVFNTAGVRPGTTVAIVGLGGVGLSAVMGAVAAGAARIVAIDRNAARLRDAEGLGATDLHLADDDCEGAVREATGGGVDCAIELAGAVPALELAFAITRRGGTTVTAGLPHPDARMQLDALKLVAEERRLLGSYIGSCVPQRDLPRMLALWERGLLPVERMLTHRLPLADINLGMDRLRTGEAIRQIVLPDAEAA